MFHQQETYYTNWCSASVPAELKNGTNPLFFVCSESIFLLLIKTYLQSTYILRVRELIRDRVVEKEGKIKVYESKQE